MPETKNQKEIHKSIDVEGLKSFLLKEISSLQAIYLYGSVVTEFFSKLSDLDVAIKTLTPLENIKRWEKQESLASSLNRNVDLLNLDQASLVMKFEVISKGIRIYQADLDKIENFETLIYSRYLDFNETRKAIIGEITTKGRVYAD